MVTIINLGSKKTEQISEVLTAKKIPNKIVSENEFSLAEIQKSSALILSGSPVLLSEIPGDEYAHYLIKYDFVKSLNIPVLGICFGLNRQCNPLHRLLRQFPKLVLLQLKKIIV